jgi:hypothetical protein
LLLKPTTSRVSTTVKAVFVRLMDAYALMAPLRQAKLVPNGAGAREYGRDAASIAGLE